MFKAICPHCLQVYTLDDSLLGKTANCKRCRNVFTLEKVKPIQQKLRQRNVDDSGFDLKQPDKNIQENLRIQIPEAKIEKRFPPESGMWNIGDIVLGVYEVKPLAPDVPFAEGGVGVVHRIYHREWDRDLAVKSPKPQVFQTESGKQSYEKEAQTWIELGLHPNIVTCYLVRRISNIPRLFAEFVPDGSLREWIRDGRLYEGGSEAALLRILNIATQFAWGLEHAHRQKLLHLDVKPANVMMSGQTAKVTDFGLAQGIADAQDSRKWKQDVISPENIAIPSEMGAGGMTPGYCSPEQYQSFMLAQRQEFDKMPKITRQSDIWSWAVSVLAMFHGRPPCKKGGQTARKVFELYLQATPSGERPKMPESVAELMFRCFQENPQDRPESMSWVADELTKIYRKISGMDFPRTRPISATWTPESINNRAASMLDLDKPGEATKLLDQAAALQPWHSEVTYNQTLLAWRNARLTDLAAIERLETLVKTRPQSTTALYALGLAQRERGNLPATQDAFENALTLEHREDIHRALSATEKVASKNVRCLERANIARGMEDAVLVDDHGEFVLLPMDDHTFDLRETATGRVRNTFKPPMEEQRRQHPNRAALSDDLLWELIRGDEQQPFLLKRVGTIPASASFSLIGWKRYFGRKEAGGTRQIVTLPDIPYIGEIKGSCVDLFNKETKKKIGDLFGHEDSVTALTFSPDGRFALTGGSDRTMRLWELPSGRCLRTFTSLGGAVDAVHFGKNGQFALSLIAGGSLRFWNISLLCGSRSMFRAPLLLSNIASAEEVGRRQSEMNQSCEEIRENIKNADFDAALQSVEKAKTLNGWESVRKLLENEGVWDVLKRYTVRESLEDALCTYSFVGHQDTVSAIAISLDGNLVASAGRDTAIRVWNISEQKCIGILEGHFDWVRSVELTMDAKFIVSGSWDMSVRVWNISTGQCIRKFDEKIKSLTKIALNPQGRIVAIANGFGSVVLWDVLTDEIKGRYLAHSGSVNTVRFNRNGQYLVTGGDDNLVAVWKIGKEEPVQTIKVHKSPITAAVLSTDLSRLVSADREGRIVVWNLRDNKMEFDIQGHFGDITGLEMLADDRFFLSCAKDMKVRLEGIQNRSVHRLIEGHPSPIFAMALDVTGRRFITGGEDAVVRIWDIYWNYKFPGWSPITPEAERTLKILLSLYSPDTEAKETPKIDEVIQKRIMLEMEYRGFGMILPEEIKQTIFRLLDHWNGPEN